MEEIAIKKYVRYLFLGVFVVFVINKLWFRSWVLANDSPRFLEIFVYSYPNFAESLMGTLILIGIALLARLHFKGRWGEVSEESLRLVATLVAGVYVISQELGFHNLGGKNVYDPYDLIASILGLSSTYWLSRRYGIFKKENEFQDDRRTE